MGGGEDLEAEDFEKEELELVEVLENTLCPPS
jgi:hypothetical protein